MLLRFAGTLRGYIAWDEACLERFVCEPVYADCRLSAKPALALSTTGKENTELTIWTKLGKRKEVASPYTSIAFFLPYSLDKYRG